MFARDWGFEARDKLVALMRGWSRSNRKPVEMLVPPMTQLAAANAILDRGYGRPPQVVEVFGGDVCPEEREGSALEFIKSRLAAMREQLPEDGHPLLVKP
jgi:hypothetical protein